MNKTLALLAALLLTTACVSTPRGEDGRPRPLNSVAHVDLSRYMGDWFVIANIPNRMERNCFESIESYALREDGRIDNHFTCRDKSFEAPQERRLSTLATVYNTETNAEWRVKLYKVLPVAYVVIDLDPDYEWAVVGHPSREYGWVLARGKSLPDSTYAAILERLRQQGYDIAQFQKVPQLR